MNSKKIYPSYRKKNAVKAIDTKFKQQKKKQTVIKSEKFEIETKWLKNLKTAEGKKKKLTKYRKQKRETGYYINEVIYMQKSSKIYPYISVWDLFPIKYRN